MKLTYRNKYIRIIFVFILLIIGYTVYLYASPDGFSGRTSTSTNGCGSCHGSTPSTEVQVSCSSQSGSWTVVAGTTVTFSVIVTHPSLPVAGVDIAIKTDELGTTDAGILIAGTGLIKKSGELCHSAPAPFVGGTKTFTFTWTAPIAAGTYYLRAVGMAANNDENNSASDLWRWMSPKTITVVSPGTITLTSPVGGEIWCAGSSQNITWTYSNVTNVKIELSSDGGSTFPTILANAIPAADLSWTWNIPGTQTQLESYKIRVSNDILPTVNSVSTSSFSIGRVTTLTLQPISKSICIGGIVTFSVNATGLNVTYQWRKDGTNINGATLKDLTIDPISNLDAGNYDCVISGSCGGQVTSTTASLTVLQYPQVTTHPASKVICLGDSAVFSVEATGAELTYQWRKNKIPINFANSNTYKIINSRLSDTGSYDVVVDGKCSLPDTSEPAILTINTPPKIISHPVTIKTCVGAKDFLYVIATGTDIHFEWEKDGVPIPNTDNDTLFFDAVSLDNAGAYKVSISGVCQPDVKSNSATVLVTSLPEITKDPISYDAQEGTDITFKIEFKGIVTAIQWRKDGLPITGAYNSTLSLVGVKLIDSGYYDCIIYNDCGSDTSSAAKLTVIIADGPILSLSDLTLNFGNVLIGRIHDTLVRKLVRNTGSEDLVISEIKLEGTNAQDFSWVAETLPLTILPNKGYDLTFRFSPSSDGDRIAEVKFTSNSTINPALTLKGFGAYLNTVADTNELLLTVKSVDDSAFQTIIIMNKGNIPADVSLFITGKDVDNFFIENSANLMLIPAKSQQNALIKFLPINKNYAEAELLVRTLLDNSSFTVAMKGIVKANSVDEMLNEANIKVYPNPSNDNIVVEFEESLEPTQIEIFGSGGEKIYESTSKALSQIWEWNGCDKSGNLVKSGVYYLQISNQKCTKRIPVLLIK